MDNYFHELIINFDIPVTWAQDPGCNVMRKKIISISAQTLSYDQKNLPFLLKQKLRQIVHKKIHLDQS
jgi:hypothetical protein